MKTIRNVAAAAFFGALVTVGMPPTGPAYARFCHVEYHDPNGFSFDQCDQDCSTMAGVCETHCGGPFTLQCLGEFPNEGECECGGGA
ncbi:MAG: hypothetical protein R2752_15730 [Vicinamibacterales bacterium]